MPGAPRGGEARLYRCQKAGKDIPLSPPRCQEPRAYCRWRTACPVHLLEKEAARAARG